MAHRPFRFLHASDFHLEEPCVGLTEAPSHLLDALIDAPYTAAQRVFDAALTEDVAFVILSGDILHADNAGPRGPLFLLDQFKRLAAYNIPIYWAGGKTDSPDGWPETVPLPANVFTFPAGRVSEYLVEQDGAPVARIVGESTDGQRPIRPGQYRRDPAGLFTVAVAFGQAEPAGLIQQEIDYWALGGRHDRSSPSAARPVVHYPGSPQGRRFEEGGLHGCTLVHVDEGQQVKTHFIPTDAVRYFTERIAIDQDCTRGDLEDRLRQRLKSFLEAAPKVDLLIGWTVAGGGTIINELLRGDMGGELLAILCKEFGMNRPAAWSASIEAECLQPLPADWYEQENIRGDFLRLLRKIEMNPEKPYDLSNYIATQHREGPLAFATHLPEGPKGQRLLRAAAVLGANLLGPEETKE